MNDIVDIQAYKQRKLAKAEAEWLEFMFRAEEFQRAGKTKFSAEMVEKAKAVRQTIDKLRGPPPAKKPEGVTPYLKTPYPDFSIMFAGADLGYPKVTPETSPTIEG